MIRLLQTRLDELSSAEKSTDRWMDYRDLALVGVLMGEGSRWGMSRP